MDRKRPKYEIAYLNVNESDLRRSVKYIVAVAAGNVHQLCADARCAHHGDVLKAALSEGKLPEEAEMIGGGFMHLVDQKRGPPLLELYGDSLGGQEPDNVRAKLRTLLVAEFKERGTRMK